MRPAERRELCGHRRMLPGRRLHGCVALLLVVHELGGLLWAARMLVVELDEPLLRERLELQHDLGGVQL